MANTNIIHKMWKEMFKYSPDIKPFQQYNVHKKSHFKTYFDVDYKEINDWIKKINIGQDILIRFFDYIDEEYKENACVVIKTYKHYGYRRFSMKVYYTNSKEKKVHQLLIECMGHSYELKFNDESVKWGMGWSIRNAIENTLHICYSHIYDYPAMPVIVFNDNSLVEMQEAVDKFIKQIKDNYDNPHSQMLVAKSYPRINVMVNVRPSYANIKVTDHYRNTINNYPLYPIAASRKAISFSHPQPIYDLVKKLIIASYTSGLYRRRYETQYALSQLLPGMNHVHYKVKTNPETEVIPYADYTVENMVKKFIERFHDTAAPFLANMFCYEYAFSTQMKKNKGYMMKIGALIFREYAAIYAFEAPDDSDRTIAAYSKVISNDGFSGTFIREYSKLTSSRVMVTDIVNAVGEYITKWMNEANITFTQLFTKD